MYMLWKHCSLGVKLQSIILQLYSFLDYFVNRLMNSYEIYDLIDFISLLVFNATFSNISAIMATSFSGGRSRSTRREPPTMGKQLVSLITCCCESSAPFFVIYKAGRELYVLFFCKELFLEENFIIDMSI